MDIILNPEQEQLIQAKVNSGKYITVDEVIAEALKLLDERDKHYQKWVEDTRQKVAVGLEQLNRGEGIEVQTVINKLLAWGHETLKALPDDEKSKTW